MKPAKSPKREIIYGGHPVREALNAGRRVFDEIYISKDRLSPRIGRIVEMAEEKGVPVKKIKGDRLTSLAGTDHHQGIGACVSPYPLSDVDDILNVGKSGKDPFLLLLDSIVDPHNLGALVRTANCAGVDGIVIPKDRSAAPVPSVSKASAGALEHVKLAVVTNVVKTMEELKKSGFWISGMDASGERSIYETDFKGPVAIVVGGEGRGIRPLVRKHCDFLVYIPQLGQVDSLNASVAGAVVMYEAYRQRSL